MKTVRSGNFDSESSCYFLDLRNSTDIIRTMSQSRSIAAVNKLHSHAGYMIKIHLELNAIVKSLSIKSKDIYFNDTGDGHVCLIRGENHTFKTFQVACKMSLFLNNILKEYNSQIGTEKSTKLLDYGIGLHSGSSVISYDKNWKKKFAFGIVLNSASRVESFTKNFNFLKILLTGYFRQQLKIQYEKSHTDWSQFSKSIKLVSSEKFDIKDFKDTGHKLYTVVQDGIE